MSKTTYIRINPIVELLKAIAIVHGQAYAAAWRSAIYQRNPELLREVE